jgi:hypothetical protein
VTSKVYVASYNVDNVTVIDETPAHDTKVRAVLGSVPGCTTSLARPPLDGEGTNGSSPYRTAMMGVCNRIGTAQKAWNWAAITSGAGTDSITWEYNWGKDSLVPGENFVCCVPFEDQTATTNNLGLGTPFAGNLEVYPVYRMAPAGGVEESTKPQATSLKPGASIVRGVLLLPQASSHTSQAASLMDATGRRVLDLRPGTNDIRHLAPGVYFVREEPQPPRHEPQTVRKMVIAE